MAKKPAKKSNSKSSKPKSKKSASKSKMSAKTGAKKLTPKLAAKKSAPKKSAARPKAPAKPLAAKKALKSVAKTSVNFAKASPSKTFSGTMRFHPLDDRIVIERVEAPEKTAGGLFIPDSAQEKPTVGKVVAVGRGHRDAKGRTRPCDVKVGDRVLFTVWAGSEIEVDGAKFVILRETDLLGVTTV